MGKPFTQIYLHLVWATWDRLPLIKPEYEKELYALFMAECNELGVEVCAIGGLNDHIHLLVRIPPTLCVSDLVKQIKGSSSHFVNQRFSPRDGFKWQGYYGAFSVSRGQVPVTRNYVLLQKERHAAGRLWNNAEQSEWLDSDSE